ncbi:MAG: hypothetical protein AAB152_10385 [Candidatus Coatesbacteria bacterium]
MLLTFRDYGLTWDEPAFAAYGNDIARFYATGGADRAAVAPGYLRLYGGLFEALAAVWVRLLPFDAYDARHLLIALAGLGGIAACWRAARLLGGPLAGLLAGALLAITPGYWGHLFNNSKDLPFAAACMWALSAWLSWVAGWPKVRQWRVAEAAVATGIALGIRMAGGLTWALAVAAFGFALWRGAPGVRRVAGRLGIALVAALAGGWMIMLAGWPWALLHPCTVPVSSLARFSRFADWDGPILFGGRAVRAVALPWDYVPRLLFLTLPEPVIILLGGGLVWWIVAAWRRRRIMPAPLSPGHVMVAAVAVVPVVLVIAGRSVLFNGLRHMLFILPPLACLAGLAAAAGVTWLRRARPVIRATVLVSAAVLVALDVATLAALHPYEHVAYNQFAGGLAGAQGRYELDYWGSPYREAALGLLARMEAEGPESASRPWRVFVCEPAESALHYLPATFLRVTDPARADFFFVIAGGSCRPPRIAPAFAVARMGVPLAWVVDLRTPRGVLH